MIICGADSACYAAFSLIFNKSDSKMHKMAPEL